MCLLGYIVLKEAIKFISLSQVASKEKSQLKQVVKTNGNNHIHLKRLQFHLEKTSEKLSEREKKNLNSIRAQLARNKN